jgi:hypothetical protein
VSSRNLFSENELLNRLLGTALHIQSIALYRELDDPKKARSALEGLRQRMSRDLKAIDEYLQKLQ